MTYYSLLRSCCDSLGSDVTSTRFTAVTTATQVTSSTCNDCDSISNVQYNSGVSANDLHWRCSIFIVLRALTDVTTVPSCNGYRWMITYTVCLRVGVQMLQH
jgi:hypothetical protein